jgi:outer membrane protein OmpA-like peptidoglycan-associated protein
MAKSPVKKTSFHLLLTLIPVLLAGPVQAQQARRMDSSETAAFEVEPVSKGPKFIPKSITGGPVKEASRVYFSKGVLNPKSAVVRINMSDGTVKEEPYVEVPLLFRVGTAELLDDTSRANVQIVAETMRRVLQASPEARFRVEGHASAEGDGALNERLARDRAQAIQATLSRLGGAPSLQAVGRGSRDAKAAADAPEARLQQDRKVLVVREH